MKVALITGGTGGIGRSLVKAFCEAGYAVAFTYKSNTTVAEELHTAYGALPILADVRVESDVESAVKQTLSAYGRIDCLVNNAGIASISMLADVTLADWENMMATNLTSAFLFSKAVMPDMISRKEGRIINITSMWGLVGASCEVAYSAAKAGLIGFTKALAKELGPSGITVNAVAPGVIETPMNNTLDAAIKESLAEDTPVGRIGRPEEVAASVLFLASDAAAFITGEVLNISGGFVI